MIVFIITYSSTGAVIPRLTLSLALDRPIILSYFFPTLSTWILHTKDTKTLGRLVDKGPFLLPQETRRLFPRSTAIPGENRARNFKRNVCVISAERFSALLYRGPSISVPYSLTLGAHAQRGLQYLGRSVCLSVGLSVSAKLTS